MSAQEARIEWTGNIQVHQPAQHQHQHQLVDDSRLCSATNTYRCTGCSWTVEVHPTPDSDEALNRAFAKHLLTTALDEP